jgi:hypothetical protein
MGKKAICLAAGLLLAASLFADLGVYLSFLSSEHLTVFTRDAVWNKPPQPSCRDMLLLFSSFQPNRHEFIVFGDILSEKGVAIENGMWDTKKFAVGAGVGKVLSVPLRLSRPGVELSADFSAGPYFALFLSNHYTFVSGRYVQEVEKINILKRAQYGLYAAVRLRLERCERLRKYLEHIDVSLGLHFFMPFSNHEYNADVKARYHLYKLFAFAGISF